MRRITIAAMSAVTGIGLIVSYHASLTPHTTQIAATGPVLVHRPRAAATARAATSPTSTPTPGQRQGAHSSRPPARATTAATPTPPLPTSGGSTPATSPSVTAAPPPLSSTFTGAPAQTQWGIVQVQITLTNGKITTVQALQSPNSNGHSLDINAYALPQLQTEAVQANTAQISAISGATVTSGGYVQSLQSAIDQAHL
jgi:uncharacterized protein with FMN-binding domain